jgi:hypothetical protein
MIREAELKETESGLVPVSPGWFVMNARDARWFDKPRQGHSLPLTGHDEYEAETFFPMLGMAIRVVNPGEPSTIYHWETEQEDFLVLSGEALLIVEGQERRLKQRARPRTPRTTPSPTRGSRRRKRPAIARVYCPTASFLACTWTSSPVSRCATTRKPWRGTDIS